MTAADGPEIYDYDVKENGADFTYPKQHVSVYFDLRDRHVYCWLQEIARPPAPLTLSEVVARLNCK